MTLDGFDLQLILFFEVYWSQTAAVAVVAAAAAVAYSD